MLAKELINPTVQEPASRSSNVKAKKTIAIKTIIKNLYYEETLSNLELSKTLVMTPPSVTSLLNSLIDEGIITEKGYGSSNGGRKPMLYGLSPDFGYIVGIDMDQYDTRMALFNMHHENVVPVKTINLPLSNDRSILKTFISEVLSLIESSGIDKSKILGVGISIPGFVNTTLGINYTFMNYGSKPLRQILEEGLDLPVFMENDASVAAIGESRFGLAKNSNNALVLKMGWGVGLGMILNGQLYRGHAGFAGEFSHIPVAEDGLLCSCGKQGCLETEASARVLTQMAQEGIREGKVTALRGMVNDPEKIESDHVIAAANMGDQYSVQILSQLGHKLGKGLAILIHLFNPELIVLGGNLAKARQFITVPVQQALNRYCIPRLQDHTRILISNLDDKAGLLGAVSLVFENIFTENK
jgi:glucokinase-like ROK family protein